MPTASLTPSRREFVLHLPTPRRILAAVPIVILPSESQYRQLAAAPSKIDETLHRGIQARWWSKGATIKSEKIWVRFPPHAFSTRCFASKYPIPVVDRQ